MASGLRMLGTVGAVLILVGFAVVGAGYFYESYYSGQATSCEITHPTNGCEQQSRASLNASLAVESFFGIGLLLGGIGTGCVIIAAIRLMTLWPPRPGVGPPSVGSTPSVPPPLPPSVGIPPGGPGAWPPPGPGSPP